MDNYNNEVAWLNFRTEAHTLMKHREESVLSAWFTEIGFTGTVGYYRNLLKHEMEIYTTKPGLLIGKSGVNIAKLEKLLNAEFSGEWSIKLIDIRGGFLSFE